MEESSPKSRTEAAPAAACPGPAWLNGYSFKPQKKRYWREDER